MTVAYFHGTCEPNSDGGEMAYATVIYEGSNEIHSCYHMHFRDDDIASNNISSYVGFIAALKYLKSTGRDLRDSTIYGSSSLVIEQMKGTWIIKEGKYKEYANYALDLYHSFKCKPTLFLIKKDNNYARWEL
jgi:ribonuclease HI